jgi:hypothetical protein
MSYYGHIAGRCRVSLINDRRARDAGDFGPIVDFAANAFTDKCSPGTEIAYLRFVITVESCGESRAGSLCF